MPTFDGGHYFLTAVVPIRTAPVKDGLAVTSPVHALRKRLSLMPTAAETPARGGGQSPFARNKRNHFARFVIIDDVAYPGRMGRNTLWGRVRGVDLVVAQPQDHLNCPFLVFVLDFDAKSGADSQRDSYLVELWNTMGQELREIFIFCEGFKSKVTDAASFAAYIASCQLETTMSFNDDLRRPDPHPSGVAGKKSSCVAGVASLLVMGLGLLGSLISPLQAWLPHPLVLVIAGAAALVAVILAAYVSIMAAGRKPFPSAPETSISRACSRRSICSGHSPISRSTARCGRRARTRHRRKCSTTISRRSLPPTSPAISALPPKRPASSEFEAYHGGRARPCGYSRQHTQRLRKAGLSERPLHHAARR